VNAQAQAQASNAQAPPATPEPLALPAGVQRVQSVEGIPEYRLANGLKVLLAPDVADDKVSINLTYQVGARHEGNGETGMAHLLEHLIFKGTPATPDPKTEFLRRGFAFNGTTSPDRTDYFATFSSRPEDLDWYLSWQADAMVNSHVAREDLEREMTVVRNEYEQADSNPFQVLSQRVARAAYTWHGYGRNTLGARSDIERVDIGRLQAFYRRFYRPDNAVLLVRGRFDVARTLAGIQRTLGAVARPAQPLPMTYTVDSAQDGERSVVLRRPAQAQALVLSYHVPPALHPDTPALNLLALALADVPGGRLHKALVESQQAMATFGGIHSQREAGQLLLGAALAPADDAVPRQKLLIDAAETLAANPITPQEFERAQQKMKATLALGFANAAAVAQGALQYEVWGDWRAAFVSRERLQQVTLDDVNRVARTYLLPSNRTLGHLIPTPQPQRAPQPALADVQAYLKGYALSDATEASVAFDFSTASLHRQAVFSTTPGGIRMAVLNKPVRGDVVELQMRLRLGDEVSLRDQEFAVFMAGQLLTGGTARYSRQQVQDESVKLGAAFNLAFTGEDGTVNLRVKKANFKAALALLAELLRNPTVPQAVVDEGLAASIKATEGALADKAALAADTWARYGNPYPKGDIRYYNGRAESLAEFKALTRDKIVQAHQRFYGAHGARVSILGPIDHAQAQALVAEAFDGWRAAQVPQRVPRPLVSKTPTRMVLDTPDKANVSIQAYLGLPIQGLGMEAEEFAMQLAVQMLGGGPGSRLHNRLREKSGLSYSVGARWNASLYDASALLSLSADVAPANASQAEAALREELQRSVLEGFSASEVEAAKRQLLGHRQRSRSGDAWAMTFMNFEMDHQI
ncbi:M16 family metallopeptidase, partial [Acidovorax sp.]|uniref:M16 family metallopeptidase n=1 Tax=Acidovorax sp. TaxID=1872122 RepID=UPI00391F622F